MPKMAWVQNHGNSPQHWGMHCIEPGALGLIPAECVGPVMPRGVEVLSDDPEKWIFKRTAHVPSNAQYCPGR